jgi:hypothetical protein
MEHKPEQPKLTHVHEYEVVHEEITLYQREMHRTWLWAIIPAGAVYTWLSLHTGKINIPWPVWFIPTGFFIICFGRWWAFESRISVLVEYLLKLEEAAFGKGNENELPGIAHYNRDYKRYHPDDPRNEDAEPRKLVRRARGVWQVLIILSCFLSLYLCLKPSSQPEGTGSGSSQTNANAAGTKALQPAPTTPVK